MKCQWCGKEFLATKGWQKYCSALCRIEANRKREASLETPEKEIIRHFYCLKCGKLVNVYDPLDNRIKFCSAHCEKLYWKHPKKHEETTVRTFQCRCCGRNVIITRSSDRRRFYCSQACRQKMERIKRRKYRESLR